MIFIRHFAILLALALGAHAAPPFVPVAGGEHQWPQAGGPHGNWSVEADNVPVKWSVARNEGIVWRTALPETGQGGIAVWGDRVFLTTLKPEEGKGPLGKDVIGYCLDAHDGKILWTVNLPGSATSVPAYFFSDATSPSPVTDGKRVWFFNACGSVGCYDYAGKQIWLREWKPTGGRPFNKQFEPILLGDTLLNMEPRDEADPKREAKDPWNYLRGLDKNTGKTLWVAADAMTHYNTPVLGMRADGTPAVLQGRGGYHGVPELPIGLSLTSLAPGSEGKTIWRYEPNRSKASYTMHWNAKYAAWFDIDASEHQVLDAATGKLLRKQSLVTNVDWRRFNSKTGKYELLAGVDLSKQNPPLKVFPAQFCNILVGDWHYFLCYTMAAKHLGPPYCVGRVNLETGKVEYLELPVSVTRVAGQPDRFIWGQPQTSSTVNSRGIDVATDKRSQGDGWWWGYLGSPTAAGGKVFFTTMLGITYVIDGNAPVLDEKALLSVNDLGQPGQTWSLNSISFAGGRLYHRSMKEVVCIGQNSHAARGALRLPAVISDHAMIQAGKPVAVWGWAAPGDEVSVSFVVTNGKTERITARTAADGRWSGQLPPVPDGTAGELEVRTKTEGPIRVADVLAGEVWLCSGQSNMSYLLTTHGRSANQNTGPEILAAAQSDATAAHGGLRYFAVRGIRADSPLDDVQGKWIVAAPDTVGDCFALSWNFAVALNHKLRVPVGVIDSAIGGTAIEPWTPLPELQACPVGPATIQRYKAKLDNVSPKVKSKFETEMADWTQRYPTPELQRENLAAKPVLADENPNMPSRLYNGMIHGLEPYTLKGFLWFQGDGNFGNPQEYGELVKTLIRAWRGHWHDDALPFYYVEMQNYHNPQEKPVEPNPMSLIREAQQEALQLPATDVAASLDQGIDKPNYEAHFPNKKPLGERLAGLALNNLYGQPGLVHSPQFKSYAVDGKNVRIRFDHAAGLRLRGDGGLKGFAIRSKDGDWVWAQGRIEGQDIVLWSDQVPAPAAVRYAWAFNPILSVENSAGLPLRPFRTDTGSDK